jgi:hypothetical protein
MIKIDTDYSWILQKNKLHDHDYMSLLKCYHQLNPIRAPIAKDNLVAIIINLKKFLIIDKINKNFTTLPPFG